MEPRDIIHTFYTSTLVLSLAMVGVSCGGNKAAEPASPPDKATSQPPNEATPQPLNEPIPQPPDEAISHPFNKLIPNNTKELVEKAQEWAKNPMGRSYGADDLVTFLYEINKANVDADTLMKARGAELMCLSIKYAHWNNSDDSILRWLLHYEDKIDINAKDRLGHTPLVKAVILGETAIVQLLLTTFQGKIVAEERDKALKDIKNRGILL